MSAAGRTPTSARTGLTLAVLLVAALSVGVAVVAVQDLLASRGWVSESRWVTTVLRDLDGTTAVAWTVVVGAALVVVGLLALVAAVLPARRTHVRLAGAGLDAWITPDAVAAAARDAADRAAGVVSATTGRTTRRRAQVRVVSDDTALAGPAAQQEVDRVLGGLDRPAVVVRAQERRAS